MKTILAQRDQANQLHSIVDMEMRGGLCIVVGMQGSVLVVVVIQVLGMRQQIGHLLRSQPLAHGREPCQRLPHHGKHQQEGTKTRSHDDGF